MRLGVINIPQRAISHRVTSTLGGWYVGDTASTATSKFPIEAASNPSASAVM